MDFKITSSRASAARRGRGLTLVEMMMAMGIGSILAAALGALSLYTARSFAAMANYVDLDNKSRTALDVISRDVRQAGWLDSFSTNGTQPYFKVIESGNGTLTTNFITFTYDKNARTLVRNRTGEGDKVLLEECDEFRFNFYQRNLTNTTLDPVTQSGASMVKAIDLGWTCSRKLLGVKANTESVQTARIVMRKQQSN